MTAVGRPIERCDSGQVGLRGGVTAVSRPMERCEWGQ